MSQKDDSRLRVVHQVLKDKVSQYGNREFFRFGEQSFGYQDFDQASDRGGRRPAGPGGGQG